MLAISIHSDETFALDDDTTTNMLVLDEYSVAERSARNDTSDEWTDLRLLGCEPVGSLPYGTIRAVLRASARSQKSLAPLFVSGDHGHDDGDALEVKQHHLSELFESDAGRPTLSSE